MERPEHETNDVVPTRTQLFFEETKRNNHFVDFTIERDEPAYISAATITVTFSDYPNEDVKIGQIDNGQWLTSFVVGEGDYLVYHFDQKPNETQLVEIHELLKIEHAFSSNYFENGFHCQRCYKPVDHWLDFQAPTLSRIAAFQKDYCGSCYSDFEKSMGLQGPHV